MLMPCMWDEAYCCLAAGTPPEVSLLLTGNPCCLLFEVAVSGGRDHRCVRVRVLLCGGWQCAPWFTQMCQSLLLACLASLAAGDACLAMLL
jgi:hypothetical protein